MVFHLAALIAIPYSYVAAESFVQTNVQGTLNVLEGARRAGVRRFVHTSTSEVYGTPETLPITEAHPLNAQSPYAATKVAADQLTPSPTTARSRSRRLCCARSTRSGRASRSERSCRR